MFFFWSIFAWFWLHLVLTWPGVLYSNQLVTVFQIVLLTVSVEVDSLSRLSSYTALTTARSHYSSLEGSPTLSGAQLKLYLVKRPEGKRNPFNYYIDKTLVK